MILYESDVAGFMDAVNGNLLAKYMGSVFYKKYSRQISISQKREWNYSLKCIGSIIEQEDIPQDCGVRIDYVLSQYCGRLEILLTGEDEKSIQNIVILQILPWQETKVVDQEDMIGVFDEEGWHDMVHPSYQSLAYKKYISMGMGAGDLSTKNFTSKVYLYDYIKSSPEPLIDEQYKELILDAPIYFSDENHRLASDIRQLISKGNGKKILNQLHMRDQFCAEGLETYIKKLEAAGDKNSVTLYEDQKMAAARILRDVDKKETKSLSIISGMPGTGKTAVAVSVLNQLRKNGKKIAFVSPHKALIHYFKNLFSNMDGIEILTTSKLLETVHKGSKYDLIICDEAQNIGESEVQSKIIHTIIEIAQVSVFLYSSMQRIYNEGYTLPQILKRHAQKSKLAYFEYELNRNIRYPGGAGALYWMAHQLQMDTNSNYTGWDMSDYEIEIVQSPNEVLEFIKEKSQQGNSARMMANIDETSTKSINGEKYYEIKGYDFVKPIESNHFGDSTKKKEVVEYIGTQYTCQGLEFDYAGVFIEEDLTYDEKTGEVRCISSKESIKEGQNKSKTYIRNIYYLLLSRGRKGCYIFCKNKELRKYLKERVEYAKKQYLWIQYFVNQYAAELEEKRIEEMYDQLEEKNQVVSIEEYRKLQIELKRAEEELETYKKLYLEAKDIMEQIGITPEVFDKIKKFLVNIKEDSLSIEDEEERIHYIQEKSSLLLFDIFKPITDKQERIQKVGEKLKDRIGRSSWDKLAPTSKNFLISAEVIFDSIEGYNTLIDFSGVCLLVTKAVEYEMTYRYYICYKQYLEEKGNTQEIPLPRIFSKARSDNDYTLGNIQFTVGMWASGKVIDDYEQDHTLFLEYAKDKLVNKLGQEMKILKAHLKIIVRIKNDYRNKAAHKDAVDVVRAKECLNYIVETQRKLGLLLEDYNF